MLLFEVKNQKLTRVDAVEPATDSQQYLKAKFTINDADWNGKAKTAYFRLGDAVYKALLNSNNECVVPSEVLIRSESRYAKTQGGKFFLSLVGEYNTVRITTNELQIDLNSSGYSDALTPKNPTENEYQQILTQYANNEAAINEAKAECETARADLVGVKNVFANAIKGNLSGAIVRADDVSPVEHNPVVKVHGKNLIPYGTITFIRNQSCLLDNPLPAGTYTISAHITSSDTDSIYSAVSINSKSEVVKYIALKRGERVSSTFTTTKPITNIDFCAAYNYSQGEADSATWSDIQLEKGSVSTEYEPYIEPTTMAVRRCGKNLVDLSGFEFNDSNYTHIRYVGDASSDALYEFLKANTGKSIVISMKRTGEQTGIDIGSIRYYTDENKLLCYIVPNVAHTIIELPDTYVCSYIYGATNGASVKDLQIEFGIVPTDFEAYKGADFTPSSDGTVEGIASLSPVMTIMTDTEGAIVECEYIKDTNKVLQKIADALNITI